MSRKLPLAFFGILLLAGCKGPPTVSACPVDVTPVERFSLCLTDGWTQTTERFGEEGSLVVSVRKGEETGTLMRIHVKKDPLRAPVLSGVEFAERAIAITRERAPNYQVVSTEPMMVSGKETILHVFDATEDAGGDPLRYYQFVTTNGDIAYGFTAVLAEEIDGDAEEALLGILRSVDFTE